MIRIIVHEDADEYEEFSIDADFSSTEDSTPTDIIKMIIKAMELDEYLDASIIKGLEVNLIDLKATVKVNSSSLTEKEDEE